MKTPSLRAVSARLEEAAQLLPGEPADPQETYDRYESVAIAILDSEHTDFMPGVLEEYLETSSWHNSCSVVRPDISDIVTLFYLDKFQGVIDRGTLLVARASTPVSTLAADGKCKVQTCIVCCVVYVDE